MLKEWEHAGLDIWLLNSYVLQEATKFTSSFSLFPLFTIAHISYVSIRVFLCACWNITFLNYAKMFSTLAWGGTPLPNKLIIITAAFQNFAQNSLDGWLDLKIGFSTNFGKWMLFMKKKVKRHYYWKIMWNMCLLGVKTNISVVPSYHCTSYFSLESLLAICRFSLKQKLCLLQFLPFFSRNCDNFTSHFWVVIISGVN